MMRRQKKMSGKGKPSPGSCVMTDGISPCRARIAGYWYVMREDLHNIPLSGNSSRDPMEASYLKKTQEILKRQRSFSLQSVHTCDGMTPGCLHLQQYPPCSKVQRAPANSTCQHPYRQRHLHANDVLMHQSTSQLYSSSNHYQYFHNGKYQLKSQERHSRTKSYEDEGKRNGVGIIHDKTVNGKPSQGTKCTGSFKKHCSKKPGLSRINSNSSDDYGFIKSFYKKDNSPLSSLQGKNEWSHCSQPFLSLSEGEDEVTSCVTGTPLKSIGRSNHGSGERGGTSDNNRGSKLKRRKAYYRDKKEGRSRSLTHIDNLDPAMLLRNEDMDSKSEPDTSQEQLLYVPNCKENRRKKLARSQVSSSEFFTVCFEGSLGSGLEEFVPASRGIYLADALRPLFEKKKISFSSIEVYVDSSKTPLPAPATTDSYVFAGKNLTIRAKKKDEKFHSRSFKQPSRKSSRRSKNKFFSASTEDPSYSTQQGSIGDRSISSSTSNLAFPSQSCVQNQPTHSHLSSTSFSNTNQYHHQHSVQPSSHQFTNTQSTQHQQQQQQQQQHHHQTACATISHEGSLKVKNTKQFNRWSGLFSNSIKDNSKMDLLVEQLNQYDKKGIPKPAFLCEEVEECAHTDWKDGIKGWSELSEKMIQQQTAIWELVETEVVYLKTVKVITDLFLSCLYNLQASNILNEIDRDRLFSNIPEIHTANQTLWLYCIYPMVEKSRENKTLLQPMELRQGFLNFGATCAPYLKYCLDQSKCQQYCREKYHENELFKAYLAWCETRKECNRLRLMDIVVRPMQRMTKYSLLLKAILKHTEDNEQRNCIEEMIHCVEEFVKSVNGALRYRQDTEKLEGIAERIEAYEVVDTRDDELESVVKLHTKLDLFRPMPACGSIKRSLMLEGDLKIKDSFSSKMDVHCFLFTDMLLVCKSIGKKGDKVKVIRQPFIVDRLVIKEFSSKDAYSSFGLVYLNEYGTANAALSLHGAEPKVIKTWIEHIKKAQKLYKEAQAKGNNLTGLERDGEATTYEEEEGHCMMYLSSRSPRGGSSRASQLSSLVPSHSGSIEMNDASNISSRAISLEQELRSSLSSDDGTNNNENAGVGVATLGKARSLSVETGPLKAPSPRRDRRLFRSKSPTPNTLTVHIPTPNLSGQSLPNLSCTTDSSPPNYLHHHSLAVPKGLLSPTHRGISYPPPSPRSLRRSHALLQSRNPPLIKSKNILSSPEKSVPLDVQVPEIRGVTPPSNDVSPVAPPQQPAFPPTKKDQDRVQVVHKNPDKSSPCSSNGRSIRKNVSNEVKKVSSLESENRMGSKVKASTSLGSSSDSTGSNAGSGHVEPPPQTYMMKRHGRNDRADAKRYHTAGAIEDIKKESNKDKDASIHKRLSWNYGPHSQQQQQQTLRHISNEAKNRPVLSSESMSSIRSSSGVSSTSSLLHSINDLETTFETPDQYCNESMPSCPSSPRLLPDVLIAVSKPDPDDDNDQDDEDDHVAAEDYLCSVVTRESNDERCGAENLAFQDSFDEDFKLMEPTPSKSHHGSKGFGRLCVSPRTNHQEDEEHFHISGQRNTGGAQSSFFNSRSSECSDRSVDILDFILTDTSIQSSEV